VKLSDSSLRLLALLMIGLCAGPELGLAIEMHMLLEILGALLFFTAFSVGARMLAMDFAFALRDIVCPSFVRSLRTPDMLGYVVPRVLYVGIHMLVIGVFLVELVTGKLW
jgi:hypothetical protein